jgi:hypothetical protein
MQKRSLWIAIVFGFAAIAFYAQKPDAPGTPMPQVVSFRILLAARGRNSKILQLWMEAGKVKGS